MQQLRTDEGMRLGRRLAVETPEHVVLEFELAGLGSRAAAAILDTLILTLLALGLAIVGAMLSDVTGELGNWAFAILIAVVFLLIWGYFLLFEALAGGRTPGKRALGIRVIMETGHPVTFAAAAVRNFVRLVDAQPGYSHLLGAIFVFFHPRSKRLGDIVAGTAVVRDQPDAMRLAHGSAPEDVPVAVGSPRLSDEEFQLLERFILRMESLEASVLKRVAADLVDRFADRFPQRDPDPRRFLIDLYDEELTRRRSRIATRRGRGRVTRVSGTAERFVALRRERWEEFRRRAETVKGKGIRELSGEELLSFAGAYREVAADLARARTYGVGRPVLEYIERVVAVGHNALYGAQGAPRISIASLLLRDLPASVWVARRYVLVAFFAFLVPALVGYSLIREQPDVAYRVIPAGMIERAQAGEQERAAGRGYAETPSPYLPVFASRIVTNNVQVAIGAFAFGITAGIGTLFVLVFNGLYFGSIFGLFANYGLGGWIGSFVAAHGVLELTAIFIAGGAGLLVGRALVAPGDLSRRDALVLAGREAIRMVAAAAFLLLLAGLIEGFLSASDAPTALKLGVSAVSAVLVVLYLTAGARASAESRGADGAQATGPRHFQSEGDVAAVGDG